MADNYWFLAYPRRARRWAARCLRLRESPNRLASAHARIAAAECRLGKSGSQLEHSLTALRLFNSENEHYDCDQEYSAYSTAARVYYGRGDVAMAASLLENALKGPSYEPWVPRERLVLGDCYRALGEHQKAITSYRAALQPGRENLDPADRVRARCSAAGEMLKLGMRGHAWEWYKEALKEAADGPLRSDISRSMARWLADSGDVNGAVQVYLQCTSDVPNKRGKAGLYLEVASMFWALGDLNRCEAWLEISMAVHATAESRRLRKQLSRVRSRWT